MNELKYDDINIYPVDIQPIIKVLLEHEERLTAGYQYDDFASDNNEIVQFLTEVAYELLTEVKKALENQIPMWEFKDGQFTPITELKETV